MDLNEFIKNFADQFDDTDSGEFTPECEFHQLDEWSSLTGMAIIAMVKADYNKDITAKELRECDTIENLYNLVNNK